MDQDQDQDPTMKLSILHTQRFCALYSCVLYAHARTQGGSNAFSRDDSD